MSCGCGVGAGQLCSPVDELLPVVRVAFGGGGAGEDSDHVRLEFGGREAAIDEIRFGNLHPCGEVAEVQELVAVDRRRALVTLWRRAAVEVDCGARGCEAGAASCATAV